jgi:hypothetical protein
LRRTPRLAWGAFEGEGTDVKTAKSFLCLGFLGVMACASTQSQLAAQAPMAVDTALTRARFDLGCPTATGEVLSSDYIQPVVAGPWVGEGVTRLEYTVGVQGCGKKAIYVTMCQEGSSTCFATPSRGPAPAQ